MSWDSTLDKTLTWSTDGHVRTHIWTTQTLFPRRAKAAGTYKLGGEIIRQRTFISTSCPKGKDRSPRTAHLRTSMPRKALARRSRSVRYTYARIPCSILTSGNILSGSFVMKQFLRPFSPTDSRRAVVSYCQKNVHYVRVNCVGGLPRNSVDRLSVEGL